MPITSGYELYQCEKCGKTEYLNANSPSKSDWQKYKRIDANGTSTEYVYCRDCGSGYRDLVTDQDKQFRTFMDAGKE